MTKMGVQIGVGGEGLFRGMQETKGAAAIIVRVQAIKAHSSFTLQVEPWGKTAERQTTSELLHVWWPCRNGSRDPLGAD